MHDLKWKVPIWLGVPPQKSGSKFFVPASYGKMLFDLAATKLDMSRDDVATAAGFTSTTAWRLETGKGTVKSARSVRAVLTGRGVKVPPIPMGELEWEQASEPEREPQPGDPTEAVIWKNLIRFREQAGYDQIGAADASGVPFELLQSYERGAVSIPTGALKTLATAYGRKPGDFFEVTPPPPDLDTVPMIHVRVRPGVQVSDEDKARLDSLAREIDEKYRRAKQTTTTASLRSAKTPRQRRSK